MTTAKRGCGYWGGSLVERALDLANPADAIHFERGDRWVTDDGGETWRLLGEDEPFPEPKPGEGGGTITAVDAERGVITAADVQQLQRQLFETEEQRGARLNRFQRRRARAIGRRK